MRELKPGEAGEVHDHSFVENCTIAVLLTKKANANSKFLI
jgi:hypothetical protein